MEIQGRIKQIFPSQIIGQNGFEKRDLVIVTEEQYPQTIIIQFTQQRCDLLNNLQVGQNVKVYINIRGREWTNPQGEIKYFNTIEANSYKEAMDIFEESPFDYLEKEEPDNVQGLMYHVSQVTENGKVVYKNDRKVNAEYQ